MTDATVDDDQKIAKYAPWTSRDVHYTVFPRQDDDAVERLMDALCDHYWERPRWHHRLGFPFPSVGSHGLTVNVSGFPRWLPKWVALRGVVGVAHRAGVGGAAVVVTERVVL